MSAAERKALLDSKTVIGCSAQVVFPQWHIPGVRAKVDTGARTSALHVENLLLLPGGYVRFDVMVGQKPPFENVHVRAKTVRWGRVRSSTGHYTVRCFVKTRVLIGPVEKEIEVSLVSRERMQYRMLLGRQALEKDFVVDVSRRAVLGKPTRKRPRRKERS